MEFLRDCWYPAAWFDEVDESPFARTLLDEPIVIFRGPDGAAVALADRCCHRALPLSMGRVVGGELQCGYHGLTFDRTGACTAVPGQSSIPPGAGVRAYPVVERWGWIWLWMGEPGAADPAEVPDFHWLDDPAWVGGTGHLHLAANYQNIIDNLTDHTHLQFVHQRTLGSSDVSDATVEAKRVGDDLRIERWLIDRPPPPLYAGTGGMSGNVDRWMNCRLSPAANFALDIGCAPTGTGAPQGDRNRGIELKSLHVLSPESAGSTHYFWGFVRNFGIEDAALTAQIDSEAKATFEEDVAVLEAQQRAIDASSGASMIDLQADAPPLLARRIMRDLIGRERGAS